MPPPTTLERYVHDLEFRGVIQGVTIKDKSSGKSLCHYFGGIPYAQPPVGDHRWKRPRELAPCYRYGTQSSPGVFDSKSGVCPQSGASKSNTYDEDCLQCNVWIPTGERPRNGWPVYFFIRKHSHRQ
jgi:carboxylesterase type B